MHDPRPATDTIDITPSDGDGYVDREVPEEIAAALQAMANVDGSPRRLGDLLEVTDTDVFSPGDLTTEEMLVTEDSRHEVRLADRTVNTFCILDALVLAFLEDEPIAIETRPPGAEQTIAFTASQEGLAGVDEAMVVSFGFSTELPTDRSAYEGRSPGQVQATIHEHGCLKINLFPAREAYEAWAEEAEAVTMPIELAEALALARDTVEHWPAGTQVGPEADDGTP